MGLYSSFDPSQYYDESEKKEIAQEKINKYNERHKAPEVELPPIPEAKKASLYEESKSLLKNSKEYNGPDFRDIYNVGQAIAVTDSNDNVKTAKGRIAEIPDRNLMYVYMEDSYKDVNENYLVEFVTDKDKIFPL